ncbi:MAG: hypothetical protein ACQKBV_12890 [Puniceicoccales bacterium]
MTARLDQAEILTLVCPDWRELEHPLRIPDPFALWPVGDQAILFHWFDYALDNGYKHVRVLVADRPDRVRQAVRQATLWPIVLEVVTVSKVTSDDGMLVNTLPGGVVPPEFNGEWDVISHWRAIENDWLASMNSSALEMNLSVGRLCRIHPTAKLIPPYFIGDYVAIGPEAVIGPNAVVGSGCLVAENTIVRESRLMPHSFLGAHLTMENSVLFGGVLFNEKNQARVERMESFIADTTLAPNDKVSWGERLTALGWWLRFRFKLCLGAPMKSSKVTLNGKQYLSQARAPLWLKRLPHLWEVACGRMRLFGPLPRSEEELEQLPAEWQSILREATPGAIAYSDCLGIHDTTDPSEALHAVYQVTHEQQTRAQCDRFLQQLTHHEGIQ